MSTRFNNHFSSHHHHNIHSHNSNSNNHHNSVTKTSVDNTCILFSVDNNPKTLKNALEFLEEHKIKLKKIETRRSINNNNYYDVFVQLANPLPDQQLLISLIEQMKGQGKNPTLFAPFSTSPSSSTSPPNSSSSSSDFYYNNYDDGKPATRGWFNPRQISDIDDYYHGSSLHHNHHSHANNHVHPTPLSEVPYRYPRRRESLGAVEYPHPNATNNNDSHNLNNRVSPPHKSVYWNKKWNDVNNNNNNNNTYNRNNSYHNHHNPPYGTSSFYYDAQQPQQPQQPQPPPPQQQPQQQHNHYQSHQNYQFTPAWVRENLAR
jgi:hypothetical protein